MAVAAGKGVLHGGDRKFRVCARQSYRSVGRELTSGTLLRLKFLQTEGNVGEVCEIFDVVLVAGFFNLEVNGPRFRKVVPHRAQS